jgi:hypothetical protein
MVLWVLLETNVNYAENTQVCVKNIYSLQMILCTENMIILKVKICILLNLVNFYHN